MLCLTINYLLRLKIFAQDEALLAQKESERSKTGGKFSNLKEAEAADSEAFAAAQRKYQAVSAGLLSSDDGADATLQEQLISKNIVYLILDILSFESAKDVHDVLKSLSISGAKEAVSNATTEKKQSEMELEHIKGELTKKEKLLTENSKSYNQDVAALDKLEKEVAKLAVSS